MGYTWRGRTVVGGEQWACKKHPCFPRFVFLPATSRLLFFPDICGPFRALPVHLQHLVPGMPCSPLTSEWALVCSRSSHHPLLCCAGWGLTLAGRILLYHPAAAILCLQHLYWPHWEHLSNPCSASIWKQRLLQKDASPDMSSLFFSHAFYTSHIILPFGVLCFCLVALFSCSSCSAVPVTKKI